MEDSEVEYHNEKVIGFCWPEELLKFLDEKKSMSVMGAAKDRRELEQILYFKEKERRLEMRVKANKTLVKKIAAEKQRQTQRDKTLQKTSLTNLREILKNAPKGAQSAKNSIVGVSPTRATGEHDEETK